MTNSEQSQYQVKANIIKRGSAGTDEEEIILLVLQVLHAPGHVVGDVDEGHVLVLLPATNMRLMVVILGDFWDSFSKNVKVLLHFRS